jgi:pimeloyl-ACP methyl ester carboxylesterase
VFVPYAENAFDGNSVYFEDDGGPGTPVVHYGGILDTVGLVRGSRLAQVLEALSGEYRLIYADHRGLGRSDKPHEVDAYAMRLQAADAVAVLDELNLERAHFIGRSYGGRLAFGIGEHAPERVLSLVAGGQQPYAMDPEGPLARVVAAVLDATRRDGVAAFVEALEGYWGDPFPPAERSGYLAQDGAAVAAASEAMLTQGAISRDLRAWRVPCLIYLGSDDVDFVEQARRAAGEIPNAQLLTLEARDHYGAHFEADDVSSAVVRLLREHSDP